MITIDDAVNDTLAAPTGPKPKADPYASAVDSVIGDDQARRRQNLLAATAVTPDAAASAGKLSRKTGIAPDLVQRNLDQVQKQQNVADGEKAIATAPVLAATVASDPQFAAAASDDLGRLSLFETLTNSFKRGWPGLRQNLSATALRANSNILGNLDHIEAELAAGRKVPDSQDPSGVQYMTAKQRDDFRAQIGSSAGGNAETIVNAQIQKAALPSPAVTQQVMSAKGWGDAVSAFSKDPLQFIASIGPESLIQSAPGLVAAIPAGIAAGPAAAAVVTGANSLATDYGSQIIEGMAREGVDINNVEAVKAAAQNTRLMARVAAQAMAHASVVGTVDAVSGGVASKLALPKAVATNLAKSPVARELANLAVQTPAQGALGAVGEVGGELAAGQPLDPGSVLAEFVGESFSAPAEVASIAGSNVRERMAQASEAKAHAAQLVEISKAAEQSKLRERDPQAFADMAAKMTDGAEVFVNAETFKQSMPPADLAKLVDAVPAIGEQLAEASTAGGDISISVADFAAHIAGTPAAELLMQHVRSDPDAMTAAQAEAYKPDEHLQAEVDKMLPAEPTSQTPQPAAVATARDAIAKSLSQVNRFTPAVNAQYVDLIGAGIASLAQRAGLDVDGIMKLVPRVVSQLGPNTGPTLDQGLVRLYRAESPTVKFDDVFDKVGLEDFSSDKKGTRFTSDRAYAEYFKKSYGKDAVVRYVDVPTEVAEAGRLNDYEFRIEEDNLRQGARGAFEPKSRTIALLEHADLSTFLHETGHLFLTLHTDIAAQEGAPKQIVDDMHALMKWFGVKDLATWQGMTLEQQRQSHEEFARAFEQYLGEGKAPTVELQGAFARFRGWLLNVYRSLANLNVNLTDEVRGVMDRMLATDSDIKDMQTQSAMAPLFESAAAAGMTPDEFARYQATGEQATEEAVGELQGRSIRDLQLIANAKGRAVKKLNAEAKAKRDAIEVAVRAEVEAVPIYTAWGDLARGRTAEGEPIRLSLHDLQENYPALVDRIPAGMAANVEHALPADIVADAYGLTSGDELVKLLATLDKPETVIEGETDRRFLEQHGELFTARGIEELAHQAIANDVRAKVLATEVGALSKATGGVQMLTRAAKQFAEAAVARKKVRELKPAQHRAAEARAGRVAAEAFKKGETAVAAASKREQLLQHVVGRTTAAALVEVEKAVDYLNRVSERKTLPPEYRDQIQQLMERFDLRKAPSLKAIDKRKSLAAWVESQEALGLTPVIDDRLLAESKLKSYRDMTVEEVRGLVDTVKNIEHLGGLKDRLLTLQDQRTFSEIAIAVTDGIAKHGGSPREVALEGERGFKYWLEGAFASTRKLGSLAYRMDGGQDNGPLYAALIRPMNEAGTAEAVMNEQATVRLAKLFAPIEKLKGGTTGGKVFIPEIRASLSRGGRLAVALNWGNEGNRQRLMDGQHWTEAQVQAVLRTLSPVELQFVNDVHAYIDSFWPEIKAQQLRVSGVVEDKVEASPWKATASDGSTVEMRGGYYPAAYDSARSAKAEQHDAAQAAKDALSGAYVRATTRRGFTKARSEEVKDRPLRLDLGVIPQHITTVTHNLAWQEWLIDANRLIGAKAIDGAIRNHYGPAVVRTMKANLQGIAAGDAGAAAEIGKALMWAKGNVTRATLGASFTTAIMQPFGLSNSMARIGAGPVLRGMGSWIGDAARLESSMTWIAEKSPAMRLRAKAFNRELHEISARIHGKSKTAQVIDAALMFLTSKAQQMVDIPTWIGAYQKGLGEGRDEATAVALADEAVISSQGGGQVQDLAQVQRDHPLLSSFFSYFSTTANLIAAKTGTTDFKSPRAIAGWLGDMALLTVIPALGPAVLKSLLQGSGGDDGEGWAKFLAKQQAAYLMSMLPLVREFSGAVAGFSYSGPPAARIVVDLQKAGQQVVQGEVDEPAVVAMARLFGDLTGAPVTQLIRSYKGWKAWADGDAPVSSVLMGPPSKG